MRSHLIKKIRKLLRLARSTGPEADLAGERARDLMVRHKLDVTIDDARISVPGVGKIFWRGHLLSTIASLYHCQLFTSTNGTVSAVVVGEHADAKRSIRLYRRVSTELVIRCGSSWSRFAANNPHIADEVIKGAYFRIFLDSASVATANRLRVVVPKNGSTEPDTAAPAEPAPVPTAGPPPAEEKTQEVTEFRDKLLEYAGPYIAQALQMVAQAEGMASGQQADITVRSQKRLVAVSSIPVPEKTRFTYLEVD